MHRIKIRAVVERRQVIAKLKAASVTVKEMDGKGMFSEVVTKADGEKDATVLVKKALEDLPTLLTASVLGKPDYDRSTQETVLKVAIEVDRKAYWTTVEKAEAVLSKIAQAHDSVLVKGKPFDPLGRGDRGILVAEGADLLGPSLTSDQKDSWYLWICSSSTGSNQNLRFNRYLLAADASCFDALRMATRRPHSHGSSPTRFTECKTMLRITLKDENGGAVSEDEQELFAKLELTNNSGNYPDSDSDEMPFVTHAIFRSLNAEETYYDIISIGRFLGEERSRQSMSKKYTINAFVAPYSFVVTHHTPQTTMFYAERRLIQVRIPVPLDDLKRIQDITCKVNYVPAAAVPGHEGRGRRE